MTIPKTCGTCGYLALRINGTGEMGEAPATYRQHGQFDPQRVSAAPNCAKYHINMPELATLTAQRLSNGHDSNGARLDVLQDILKLPRDDCPFWAEYLPLHSPKEHDKIMWQRLAFDVQKQIAAVQVGMVELQRDALRRQVEQFERDGRLAERLQAVEHRRHREAIVAVIVAAVIGAVVAGAFSFLAHPSKGSELSSSVSLPSS